MSKDSLVALRHFENAVVVGASGVGFIVTVVLACSALQPFELSKSYVTSPVVVPAYVAVAAVAPVTLSLHVNVPPSDGTEVTVAVTPAVSIEQIGSGSLSFTVGVGYTSNVAVAVPVQWFASSTSTFIVYVVFAFTLPAVNVGVFNDRSSYVPAVTAVHVTVGKSCVSDTFVLSPGHSSSSSIFIDGIKPSFIVTVSAALGLSQPFTFWLT